jgi:hypothetical protein
MMPQPILNTVQYAFRITDTSETPCHLSEIKKGDVYYQVSGADKSELLIATGDAFATEVNHQMLWSIPHEIYR